MHFIKPVDKFVFSIHALGKIHDEIVGKEGTFISVEGNFRRASLAGKEILVNMVLVKSNYDEIERVFNHLNAIDQKFKFSPFLPIHSLFGNDFTDQALVVTDKLMKDYIKRLHRLPWDRLVLKHGMHSIYINDLKYYTEATVPLPNCAAGKYKLVVEADGSVYPCNYFKGERYYCGNLLLENEDLIWSSGIGFQPFRELVLREQIPERCKACLKKFKCFSGCRAWSRSYREGGFENAQDIRCELGNAFIRIGDYNQV